MLSFFHRNVCSNNFMKIFKTIVKPKSGKNQNVNRVHTRVKRGAGNKKMDRIWECTDAAKMEQHLSSNGKQYKLMSYNILAQDLLVEHLHLYLDVEPPLLRWEHRLRRLKEEIQEQDPDILCLQEMQYNHLRAFVKKISGCRKLEYVFKKKTGHRTDGCAIIYDKTKFQLLEERGLEYYTAGVATLNRENVALLAKFKLRNETKKEIIVATTHLLYNPKRQDVRMAQVEVLLRALHGFSNNSNASEPRLPVVLTGDFNFEPFTPPHALLTAPNDAHRNCTHVSADNCLEMLALNFGNSAASTLQTRWIIVDYILHSIDKNRQKIKVWSVYRLPTIQECIQCGKIPNRYLGSDHFSLAMVFSVL